jgi:peptidyl-prolyl cis-trans isomerase D
MTMLDSMRRHKGWLKWSLGIVGVTFVWFYVPSFFRGTQGTAATDALAVVDGREVLVGAYQRLYQQQVQSLRAASGSNFDEKLVQQLGIAQRLIMQMVDSEAVLAEAARLGITVSDAELAERITRKPGLTDPATGQFIGETRYRQLLQMQRPPVSTGEFEEQVREELVTEKLQAAITGWVRVSDTEVDEEYRHRNEKVKLDLAVFTSNQFRTGIQPTDAELGAEFAAHQDTYKMPEKRRVRYLSIDADALRAKMTVTTQEVEAAYQSNIQTYSTPEQIRASHILFKTEGKDEAAVKKVAESVLAKAKAPGADFARLAKQYSEDSSKDAGGDLDYFGHGRMVKEFDDAAWALKPGEISGLVKSQFGFHIIKLTDRKAAAQRTLAEVRPQIEDQLRYQKAQAEAARVAGEIASEIKTPVDLDRVARARGLQVGDSGLFSREEPLAGIGFAPDVASQAFTMQPNTVSGQLRTNQGFAFIALAMVKAPYIPKLDEVKDKVKENVINTRAVDVAKAKAAVMAQTAKSNFSAAAKAAGVTVKTTDLIARGSAYPEIGANAAVDAAVFGLKAGETTPPIPTATAVVIAHVKERQDIDAAKAGAEKDTLRSELLQQARGTFFAAYMGKAKDKLQKAGKITFNEAAIKAILGG